MSNVMGHGVRDDGPSAGTGREILFCCVVDVHLFYAFRSSAPCPTGIATPRGLPLVEGFHDSSTLFLHFRIQTRWQEKHVHFAASNFNFLNDRGFDVIFDIQISGVFLKAIDNVDRVSLIFKAPRQHALFPLVTVVAAMVHTCGSLPGRQRKHSAEG